MFFVVTPSSLCREPLAIGEVKADAIVELGLGPSQKTSKAQAANQPPEPATAEADMATDDVAPPDAAPLVADLGPPTFGDGDEVLVEAFEAAPRPRTESESGAFPLPSSAVVETAKDEAMAVVMALLPGPRQSVMESTPP